MQRTVPVLRAVGALSLFVIAADHLYEYYADGYSAIPTIGWLFLLNGIGATALGVMLLTLPRRVAGGWALALAGAAGAGLAASSLAALFVSESEPLFGFMEYGYRPVVVVAIASEAVAVVTLTLLCALLTRPTAQAVSRSRSQSAARFRYR
ncbi:MAG: hypothetical protein FWD04_07210 [Conexibacteraceae bacterium]|nr:hypothetical protein [Conexibacteraceae bacterium]